MTVAEQGYEAHSQNAQRDSNPFTRLAKQWDDGWCERETERRKHHLDPEAVSSFVEHVAGFFGP